MEIVMYKSLKFASLILATASIVQAGTLDDSQIGFRVNLGLNSLYTADGDNPGTILTNSGSTSNFAQNYTTAGVGLSYEKGDNFAIFVDVNYQPTGTTYANPSGNITATSDANAAISTLTVGGANIANASTTATINANLSTGTELVATENPNTTTVTLKSDTNGKMDRDTSYSVDATFLYKVNGSIGLGVKASTGQSEIKVGTLAAQKVNETSFSGVIALQSSSSGFGLELDYALVSNAKPNTSSDGNDKKMNLTSTRLTYSINAMG